MPIEYVKETYQMQLKPLLMRSVLYFGSKEGIYSPDHHGGEFTCTWRDAYGRICRLANALQSLGVDRGDKVGSLAWNTHRHGELSFAVPMMGSVFHPTNIRYGREHLIYAVNHSKDKIMFVDEDLIPLVEDVSEELKTIKSYVIMTPLDKPPQTKLSPVYSYEELLRQASPVYDFPDDIPENSLAMLTYTGGTTGLPKGVGWSPRSMVLSVFGLIGPDQVNLCEEDTVMPVVNLFHINAHNFAWATAMLGGRLVWPGPHPSPEDQLSLIEKEKVTLFQGATAVLLFAMQEWDKGKYDLSSLSKVYSGSTAPNQALIEALEDKGLRLHWTYGMAEGRVISNTVTSRRKYMEGWPKEKYLQKMTRQGLPMPGTEVRVVNLDTGKDVAWDGKEKGEVLVRGLWTGQEYYNEPEATSKVFKDSWLHTGDVAVVEEDGYLYLVDRIKDIIKSAGEWISSVDLENAIMDNPVVRQAAVFGIPHPKWEERPVAAVVLKDEYKGRVTEEDIISPLRFRFAKWWLPDHVLFLDELPMTGTMKVMKRVLRDMWAEGKLKV
ncbi:MAG: AMP-binding protein [Dehalococcoidales bacterium]|nr:AMP-binding protein [Dehalococcoidales bacterium]